MKWNTSHHESLQGATLKITHAGHRKEMENSPSFSAGAICEFNQALRMDVAGSINGFMDVSQLHAHGTIS